MTAIRGRSLNQINNTMDIPFPYNSKEDITIKISSSLCEDLVRDIDFSKVVSGQIDALYRRYEEILDASNKELEGVLAEEDMQVLKDTYPDFNIRNFTPSTIESKDNPLVFYQLDELKDAFFSFLDTSKKFEDKCQYFEIDCSNLIDKIKSLTAAQFYALFITLKQNTRWKHI